MKQINTQDSTNEDKLYNKAIYNESTKSYYLLGRLIVEEEKSGQDKAQYGKKVVENLSQKLTVRYGRGFFKSTLKDCRLFYKKYVFGKSQSLTDEFNFKLSFTHYTYLVGLEDLEKYNHSSEEQ